MKKTLTVLILALTTLCADSISITEKFSWKKVYIVLENANPQKLELWIVNDNASSRSIRYKTAFRINRQVFRPKKSKRYRTITLPAQQRVLVETFAPKSASFYVEAFVKTRSGKILQTTKRIDNRDDSAVVSQENEMCAPAERYSSTRAAQNARLNRRIWQRRQQQREKLVTDRKTK